jgi:hypothetical protein
LYNDGATPITPIPGTSAEAQIVGPDGTEVERKNLDENGNYSEDVNTAGAYTINIFVNTVNVGSTNIIINLGDDITGQNVVTNRGSLYKKKN